MLQEENELLTRTGPGTPAGDLLRRYWQPAALSKELPPERPAKAVHIMGEDLVVFRDDQGRLGLIDRHCAHRAADLSYGRLEDGGIRCCYHGWLYDVTGQCLEQPAEPAGSRFHEKVRIKSYPCQEVNGIIYAYMGPGEPPLMPAFDWLDAPDEHLFVFKGLVENNWLQSLEGEIDPSHLSFLHRYFQDDLSEEEYTGELTNPADGTEIPITRILREQYNPTLELEHTDYGLRIYALRDISPEKKHTRISNFIFPNGAFTAIGKGWDFAMWHVPIDDEHNWRYEIFCNYGEHESDLSAREALRAQRLESYAVPSYQAKRNRANGYGYDPEEQKQHTYVGIGYDVVIHDSWATEGEGTIQDRTRENLAYTDKAIAAARRMLLTAVRDLQEGGDGKLPLALRDPAANNFEHLVTIDTVSPSDQWRSFWRQRHAERKRQSPWARAGGQSA